MPRRVVYGAAAGVAAFAVACSLAFPLDRFHGGQVAVPPGDAANADVEHVPACPLAKPPSRPNADDPSETELDTLVFALRSTSARLDAGRAESIGYDLDGYCTCANLDKPSCALGKQAAKCDADGGVDNHAAALVVAFALSPVGTFSPASFESYVTEGRSTVLIEVRKYNGKPNDTRVEVSIFGSSGRMKDGGDPDVLEPPQWDGNDVWATLKGATEAGGLAKTRDLDAYVSNGVLVARLQPPADDDLAAPQLGVTAQIQEGLLTGHIGRPDGGLWELQSGVVAGRLPQERLLRLMSTVPDIFDNTKFVCAGSGPSYQSFKTQVCENGDIAASASADGRDLPCNALSIGVGFEATQARRGGFGNDLPIVYGCGVDYKDSCDGGS